jgi:Polyketide cyclase / dehydrase and lipid transport
MPETPDSTHNIATVERLINAPAAAIFDLLADPARHQEIDGSGTVKGLSDDAKAGSQRLALGSKFGMSMKMGIGYTMENTVVEFEDNVRIAWQPRPTQKLMAAFIGGRIWRYQLVAQDGGTLVRESWDISQEKQPWTIRGLRSKTVDSMTKTLERIAQVVEG